MGVGKRIAKAQQNVIYIILHTDFTSARKNRGRLKNRQAIHRGAQCNTELATDGLLLSLNWRYLHLQVQRLYRDQHGHCNYCIVTQ